MALFHYEFYSETLKKNTASYVVVPEYQIRKQYKKKLKVLYLLHGLSDNYTKWMRRTPIERYAKDDNWVVVMPDAEKSYYTNDVYGEQYWDYISKELPEIIKSTFSFISEQREDTYVAGLSMGGYGSIKLALNAPDQFCAAASFSGALNIKDEIENYPENSNVYSRVFGSWENIKGTENDLFNSIQKLKEENEEIPRIYISCGTEDDMYNQSQDFKNHLDQLEIPYTYEEWEGKHDWIFWDESIKRALVWFLKS